MILRTKLVAFLLASMFICVPFRGLYAQQTANINPSNAYNCTNVAIEDLDPNLLTKEERIALLDQSLSDSIDSYSVCVNHVAENMSGGGSGDASGGVGQGNSNSKGAPEQGSPQTEATEQAQIKQSSAPNNTPVNRGVIPPKDNDKTICKLLYQEIVKATDSNMLKGLQKQYSDYKCAQ